MVSGVDNVTHTHAAPGAGLDENKSGTTGGSIPRGISNRLAAVGVGESS